jgi:hypothetical protein
MMNRSGVRVHQMAAFLGHSDPKATVLCLGLDLGDMTEAMQQHAGCRKAATEENLLHGDLDAPLSSASADHLGVLMNALNPKRMAEIPYATTP